MAVLSYNEILSKKVIIFDDEPFLVVSHHVFRKQQRKPVNVTKLKSLISGRVVENTFHVNETAEEADLEKKTVKYLYTNKGESWFCLPDNPRERFSLSEDIVGDVPKFIPENNDVAAVLFNDEIISVSIPIKVELKVKDAPEAVKGNTSSGATKEAVMQTGYTLQVPQFINPGDVIAINTESGQYTERVEKA